MSDFGDTMKAFKESERERKRKKIIDAVDLLDSKKIEWTSNNGGVHIIITHGGYTVDFWPSNDRFRIRGMQVTMTGVDYMLIWIGEDHV